MSSGSRVCEPRWQGWRRGGICVEVINKVVRSHRGGDEGSMKKYSEPTQPNNILFQEFH